MNIFKTNIEGFLQPHAVFALRQAAEKVINDYVDSYRKKVEEAIYEEMRNISVKFEKFISKNDSHPQLKIILEDRRQEKVKEGEQNV